jgi:hypothetical protein
MTHSPSIGNHDLADVCLFFVHSDQKAMQVQLFELRDRISNIETRYEMDTCGDIHEMINAFL